MKSIKLICEKCHATVSIEKTDSQKTLFCTYCGTKQMIDDEVKNININRHYKEEDVARIKESESKLKIKEMEFAEREKERKNDRFKVILGLLAMLILLGGLSTGIFFRDAIGDVIERTARGEPITINILIEFLESGAEAAEITINRTLIGIQSSGTLMTYSVKLPVGTNRINFVVGDLSESRDFEVLETDYYFHFILEERNRWVRSNTLNITFEGLITISEVENLLSR